jgi:CRISPR-associated protein Cmr2
MEQVVINLSQKGEMILPAASLKEMTHEGISPDSENNPAGLYPDHLILKLTKKNFTYKEAEEEVLKIRTNLIEEILGTSPNEEQKSFFINYFQLYSVGVTLSDKEDPIKSILPLLDSMEQKASYVPTYTKNYLKELFEKRKESFLYKRAFANFNYRFPSTIEIAAQSLKQARFNNQLDSNSFDAFEKIFKTAFDSSNENEENLIKGLKRCFNGTANNNEDDLKSNEQFRFHHKYIAIVQADGDNLSHALHALFTMGNATAIQKFSNLLLEFGKEATSLVINYGGTPIYMGGDDLMFFAPVKMEQKTIFHLIKEIDECFKTKMLASTEINDLLEQWKSSITHENRRKKINISFSYGISISYYKFPLKESVEIARKLLFEEAKMVKGKNAVSFRLLKHSGQYFGTTISKDWESFTTYLFEILAKTENEIIFLTSVQHKLGSLRPALYRILTGREIDPIKASFKTDIIKYLPNEDGREIFVKNLMDNFFNEEIHNKHQDFLNLSFSFLLQVYRDMEDNWGNNADTARKAVDTLYAILRFIKFIYQPDHNETEED